MMTDERALRRIEAWEANGLIDAETAARLRVAEAVEPAESRTDPAAGATPGIATTSPRSMAAAFFGPAVAIGEVFGYIGAGFILAAWHVMASTFVNQAIGDGTVHADALLRTLQLAVPAVVLAVLGVLGSRRGERAQRAAGVAFAAATIHAGLATVSAVQAQSSAVPFEVVAVVAAGVAVLVAAIFRRWQGSVLTQLTLLGALLALSFALLGWLSVTLFPVSDVIPAPGFAPDNGMGLTRALLTLGWWIAWAVGLGVLARNEARAEQRADRTEDARAKSGRRATVTRFAAGLTAVLGTWTAISQSTFSQTGDFERVIPVLLGDLMILGVSAGLIWLAFRREATAYVYPAAIGVIVALSDLNGRYIADPTGIGVALLFEGLILLAGGVLADRLRRRLAPQRPDSGAPGALVPVPASAADPEA
jgi:hypothetical protein